APSSSSSSVPSSASRSYWSERRTDMSSKRANQLEQALERAARGETVEGPLNPLIQTAQRLSALAEPPPPAPHNLAPGRQRFLGQAAALRDRKTSRRGYFWPLAGPARMIASVTIAV